MALKEDNTYFNAAQDSLQDFRNTDLLKSIRSSMLSGQWHENCVRCQTETSAGVRARIQYERELRSSIITAERAIEVTDSEGAINVEDVPLSLLDVRFGNQCNLACRTCNPTESSRWYGDHRALYGDTFQYGETTLHLNVQPNGRLDLSEKFFDWYENRNFTDGLPLLLKDISQIYIAGGEPLKTKAHSEFLEKIIKLGFQDQISIEYNTNGYVIAETMWDLWSQFKEIKIGLSIDSIFSMNDYIRYPSQWEVLEKNIQRFDKSGDKIIVWLCLTVHCYNIFYLPEIIEWKIRSRFRKINNSLDNMILSDHPLHNPKHLNIQILPAPIKNQIIAKFENFKKKVPQLIEENELMAGHPQESIQQIFNFLDSYVKFMMQADLSPVFPKFLAYTDKLDNLRQESFAAVFPEFRALFPTH